MPAEPRATHKKYVLIVDDNRSALEAMEAALYREFRVLPAPDLPTANTVLEREAVSLIILDVILGEESGLDLLARLRQKSDVPVLLISGFGTKEMLAGGMRARASDYLDKPFTATQLLDKARGLILQGPRPSHISERIRHFIEQHYTQDWTVESLAKALNLSVRTMRQMFRRRYQQSVMDFLEEVRVRRAGDLLATTDLSIHEISAVVGFRDPHYFGRVFRQRAGKSPREFRSTLRREPVDASDSAL
jgi:YesN/AraC family two-component response regulator